MPTFEEYLKKPSSEKITLAIIEASSQVKIFENYSGNTYSKSVNFFIQKVKNNNIELEKKNSLPISNNEFYFDALQKKLYINVGTNPVFENITLFYKLFFSSKPLILKSELTSGIDVEYLPLIKSVASIGQQLDDEATGIVLETSSSITLINDGFFDEIYDTLIWENKSISFYSWFNGLPASEIKKIFDGVIESKSYSQDSVVFKVKDFIFKLRDQLTHTNFSLSDGVVADSVLGTPKRRIYGQVKNLQCVGVDLLKDGFRGSGTITIETANINLTGQASASYVSNDIFGTVSALSGTKIINGSGTNFLSMLNANDRIKVTNGLVTYTYTVFNVISDSQIETSSVITISFSSFTAKNPSRGNKKVYGSGTLFSSQIQQGSSIRFTNGITNLDVKVEYVNNDTELTLTDPILSSFNLFSIENLDVKRNIINGTGTQFISECSVGDLIKVLINNEYVSSKIDSITSNTKLTLSEEIIEPVNDFEYLILPENSYWKNNRKWNVAGHKLREPTTEIIQVVSNNRIIVNDSADIFENDRIIINGKFFVVRRIVGNEIVTQSSITPDPIVGDIVKKIPIQNVYFGLKELIYSRDWDYINTSECNITFTNDAEFNITQEKILGVSLVFTSGSRSLTTIGIVDFRSILKARDRIRKNSNISGENDFYEILDVKEQEIILRDPYTGSSETQTAYYKSIDFIKDDSLVLVNCLGMEDSGKWVRTPSDVVKHLVLNDAGFLNINYGSFEQSNNDCDYTVSIFSPEQISSKPESIRNLISKINESIFGALFSDNAGLISYSILNSDKVSLPETIYDDDIIYFTSESSGKFYNKISVKFCPFTDQSTGLESFKSIDFESDFVNNVIETKNTLEKTIYIFDESKAIIIAQRLALFNSLANTKITLRGKMNFALSSVGDKLMIKLDRLFRRFGNIDKRRIGFVVATNKGQYETEVTLSDLGNVFNRVSSIASNSAADYSLSSENEKIQFGYIVDNFSLTPENNSESGLGNNLIG